MAKKLKSTEKSDDAELAEAIRTSAQQIWQAGLGAFAKAQEEGGKVFARLVKEGTDLQKRTQKLAGSRLSEMSDSATALADDMGRQASGSWDKLEKVFEDRVSRSLSRLGVPTQKDIEALSGRIDELGKAVTALSGQRKAAPGKAASKINGAKKAAPKKAAGGASAKSAARRAAKSA